MPDQTRLDIKIKVVKLACLESFNRQGAHHGVIGAVFQWCDEQLNLIVGTGILELLSKDLVGRDSTSDANPFQPGLSNCLDSFGDQAVNNRLLEGGGHVCNLFRRNAQLVKIDLAGAGDCIADGRFQAR